MPAISRISACANCRPESSLLSTPAHWALAQDLVLQLIFRLAVDHTDISDVQLTLRCSGMLGSWRCIRTESLHLSQPSTRTLGVHKRPSIAVHWCSKHNPSNTRFSESRRRRSLLTTCRSQQRIAFQKGKPLSCCNVGSQISSLHSAPSLIGSESALNRAGKRKKEPIEARVLTAILGLTSVPYR